MILPMVVRGLYWVGWLNLLGAALLLAAAFVFGPGWSQARARIAGGNS